MALRAKETSTHRGSNPEEPLVVPLGPLPSLGIYDGIVLEPNAPLQRPLPRTESQIVYEYIHKGQS